MKSGKGYLPIHPDNLKVAVEVVRRHGEGRGAMIEDYLELVCQAAERYPENMQLIADLLLSKRALTQAERDFALTLEARGDGSCGD